MNIALIGYGRMGHEIEAVAIERGHNIALIIDQENQHELNSKTLEPIDVAIEFSTPETALNNITLCLNAGVPTVSGTTGWTESLEQVKVLAQTKQTAFFYASNYSIGVNLFFKVNELLARLVNKNMGYNVSIEETHHIHKKDAPSGTAISIAQTIFGAYKKYDGWSLLPKFFDNQIPIKSIREGEIAGIHSVLFDSEQDQIILTHKAKSRRGFALGAVLAAEFTLGKKGFLTMDNLLDV